MNEKERYVSCIVSQEEADEMILLIRRRKTEIGREKDSSLAAQVRRAVLDYVRDPEDGRPLLEYVSDLLGRDGQYLSNLFKEEEGVTIRDCMLEQRAEYAKDLMADEGLTITDIARRCGYSSVAHMSNQFKAITALTPTEWRRLERSKEKGNFAVND